MGSYIMRVSERGHMSESIYPASDDNRTLLPSRAEVRRDLNNHQRLGQVYRRVANLGDEDRVVRVLECGLELLEDGHPLIL